MRTYKMMAIGLALILLVFITAGTGRAQSPLQRRFASIPEPRYNIVYDLCAAVALCWVSAIWRTGDSIVEHPLTGEER